jgi:PAS domain S-box-containing protein
MEIATDITDKKNADELLRESEERFMSAFKYAAIGIALVSPEGKWLRVNPALCNIVGYSEEELLSLTFQDITYAEDLETDLKYVHQMLAGEIQNYHMEKRYIHKKGHMIWVLLSVSLVKDRDGNPLYFIAQIQDITNRKKAAEALKDSEKRFRNIIDNSSFGIGTYDETGQCVVANKVLADIIGATVDQLLSQNFYHIKSWHDSGLLDAAKKALETGMNQAITIHITSSFGKDVWMECSFVPYKEEGNKFLMFIVGDISDRRNSEIALEESEKKYRRFFTTVPNAWAYHKILVDKDGKPVDYVFLEVNEAFEKQTGLKRVEIVGRRVTDVLPGTEKDPAGWIEKYGQVALTGKEIRLESYSKNINKWFAITASSPEKGYFIVIFDDITERKEVEQKVVNQKDFLNNIFESLTHPLYVINADNYEVTHMNSAARPDKGSDGITCYKLSHGFDKPCDTDDHPCVVELIKEKKEPVMVEHTHYDKYGDSRIVEVHGYPIFDKKGNVKQVIEYNLDITDRKKSEVEKERLNKELEQVIHATSHDLRSPLVNISGYSKELGYALDDLKTVFKDIDLPADKKEKIKSITEEDIAESMKYITTSINKMDSLLTSLLKLSRSGSVEMMITDCDMNRIVADVLDAMEYQLVTAGAKCEVSELPLCRGDERQLNQLFSNLIGNAIKYLDPERDGIIIVTGYKTKHLSVYCVEDNGIGIEHESLIRIFDVFHQISPDSEGEGIGLSIVKKIIDRLGGDIWIESDPGKGSKFYVSLPA